MPTQPKRRRLLPVLLAVTFVIAVTVATVYAYLSAQTDTVTNTFSADEDPSLTISENFDKQTKSDVFVQVGETGYTVYVRAAIVVTWKDDNGNVLATKPVAGTDYTIVLNESDWFEEDGFYYHKEPVPSGGSTKELIDSCAPISGKTPEGYGLNVEIIAQTIQAKGTTDDDGTSAVTDAWGVKVDSDGNLTK